MALTQTLYLRTLILMFLSCLFLVAHALAQENRNVARVVVWQAKQGMARELEEGYKRHLGWHRYNGDSWTFRGWTIISGEQFGYFVDGTFFHRWSDLDSPVSSAADAADNAENVLPYGEIRTAAIYEGIPQLTNLDSKDLMSPLLSSPLLSSPSVISMLSRGGMPSSKRWLGTDCRATFNGIRYSVLRPETGISEYLLLLPADKQSELRAQSELISRLLQPLAQGARAFPWYVVFAPKRLATGRN
jgi:hypothetical protein